MVKSLEINIGETKIQSSVSIGIASLESSMVNADDMLLGADKALYAAKNAGRDRVYLFAQGQTFAPEMNT